MLRFVITICALIMVLFFVRRSEIDKGESSSTLTFTESQISDLDSYTKVDLLNEDQEVVEYFYLSEIHLMETVSANEKEPGRYSITTIDGVYYTLRSDLPLDSISWYTETFTDTRLIRTVTETDVYEVSVDGTIHSEGGNIEINY